MALYECIGLIATGLYLSVIADTLGPLCLDCVDISEPTHCATVTQCGGHEQCYLETFVNSVGSIVYRQGCRDNRQCQLETLVGKRGIYRKSSELLVCSHCCSGHVCNSAGCGHAGYLYPRGPVCFNCQDQRNANSCNKITMCGVDEVCNLHFTTNAVTHDKIYETKCRRRQECVVDLANFRMIISVVEKRDEQDSLSSGGICLFQCCSTDVCNNGCSNNSQSYSGSTTAVTTMTTSSAFVKTFDHCLSNPCRMGTCSELGYTYKCTCERGFYGRDCENASTSLVPSDCYDILYMGIGKLSGIYNVTLWKSHRKMQVYCDMNTDGGGWTVFQSRFDGSVDFFRNYSQYEYGFGSPRTEFWLGLAFVQEMVTQNRTELRLDLTAADNSRGYEVFKNFRLGEKPGYNLYIGSVDLRYGLYYHNNRPFATYDRDTSHYCAVLDHGGWWYGNCAWANLNGEYALPGTVSQYNAGEGGMIYSDFQSLGHCSLIFRFSDPADSNFC